MSALRSCDSKSLPFLELCRNRVRGLFEYGTRVRIGLPEVPSCDIIHPCKDNFRSLRLSYWCWRRSGLSYGAGVKKKVVTPKDFPAGRPFSAGIQVGDTLYVSGSTGSDLKTGKVPEKFEDEVQLCFDNIDEILKAGGYGFARRGVRAGLFNRYDAVSADERGVHQKLSGAEADADNGGSDGAGGWGAYGSDRDGEEVGDGFSVQVERDVQKALSNLSKHGVTFSQGASVFLDPLAATVPDDQHSDNERRWVTLGLSVAGTLLVVIHTYDEVRPGSASVRIISVRPATPSEMRDYEEGT